MDRQGRNSPDSDITYGFPEWGLVPGEYDLLHRFAVTQRNLFFSTEPLPGAPSALRHLSAEGLRMRIATHHSLSRISMSLRRARRFGGSKITVFRNRTSASFRTSRLCEQISSWKTACQTLKNEKESALKPFRITKLYQYCCDGSFASSGMVLSGATNSKEVLRVANLSWTCIAK